MNYYIEKLTEMLVPAGCVALLTAIGFAVARWGFKKNIKLKTAVLYVLMSAYLTVLLVPAIFERGWNPGDAPSINLIPFNDIMSNQVRPTRAVLMIGLNTAVFIPWGFLLPAIYKPFRKFRWVLAAGLGMSLIIEVTQLLGRIGVFESDDLIFNTLGTILGFILYKIYDIIFHRFKTTISNEEGIKNEN